jgi:hypothetical protein
LEITTGLIQLVAVANLPDPVHDDPVAHPNPFLDDETVCRPIPSDDRAPVRDSTRVDDVDVPPAAIRERRPPGEEDSVLVLRVGRALIVMLDRRGSRLDDGDRDLPGVVPGSLTVFMAPGQVESDHQQDERPDPKGSHRATSLDAHL